MQKLNFEEAVETLSKKDGRYQPEAYSFVRDALDFTIQTTGDADEPAGRHVSGPELLHGLRRYALQEFGPMVTTVLGEWGIQNCGDVGHIVFNLIGVGVFGRADTDSVEDFVDVFDFEEAFVKPYLPASRETSIASGPPSA